MQLIIKEITPGYFHIKEAKVHVTLVVGSKKALLWDTGYGITDLMSAIRSITMLPLIVINSHSHIDHIGGNFAFDEVYINPAALASAAFFNSAPIREIGLIRTINVHHAVKRDYSLTRMTAVREGKIFDLGDKTVEVIEIPGHTEADLALWIKEDEVMLTADAVNYVMWLYFSDQVKQSTIVNSLTKLVAYPIKNIIASHRHTPLSHHYLVELRDVVANLRKETCIAVDPSAMPLSEHTDLLEFRTLILHKEVQIVMRENQFDIY